MAAAVLANEVTKVGSQTHVRYGGLVVAPSPNRQALEQNEALSVDEVVPELRKESGEMWQGEVGLQTCVRFSSEIAARAVDSQRDSAVLPWRCQSRESLRR